MSIRKKVPKRRNRERYRCPKIDRAFNLSYNFFLIMLPCFHTSLSLPYVLFNIYSLNNAPSVLPVTVPKHIRYRWSGNWLIASIKSIFKENLIYIKLLTLNILRQFILRSRLIFLDTFARNIQLYTRITQNLDRRSSKSRESRKGSLANGYLRRERDRRIHESLVFLHNAWRERGKEKKEKKEKKENLPSDSLIPTRKSRLSGRGETVPKRVQHSSLRHA